MSQLGAEPHPTIRKARKEDAYAIAEVIVKTWRAAYRGQLPEDYLDRLSLDKPEAFWKEALSHPRSPRFQTFVAVLNDHLVGVASIGPSRDEELDSESTAEVYAIYLLHEYWGRGIGRSLMESATEEMRAQGMRAAILWTLETNVRTRRFYEAAGWHPDGAIKDKEFGEAHAQVVRYRIVFA